MTDAGVTITRPAPKPKKRPAHLRLPQDDLDRLMIVGFTAICATPQSPIWTTKQKATFVDKAIDRVVDKVKPTEKWLLTTPWRFIWTGLQQALANELRRQPLDCDDLLAGEEPDE
jgi:hypothetical protein